MMLHVLLATALSASPALPTDSVRNASKAATARRDTTVTAPRDTTLTAAKQATPPQAPSAPASSNVTSDAGASTTAPAAPAQPSNTTTTSGAWTTTLVKSSTVVVSTSSAASAPAGAVPAASAPTTSASATATPVPAPVVAARPEHSVVQQAASAVPVPAKTSPALVASNSTIVSASAASRTESVAAPAPHTEAAAAPAPKAAPADVSAVAPRPAEKSTRVDARTVVSIRSSERIEPLYSVPLPGARVRLGAPSIADSIVVYKRERTLTLFYRGVPVKSYFIALGLNPVGDKQRAGDGRTPEGLFHVNAHNPASKYHLALRISYPDDAHRARAAAIGADPGGDIMIHGLPPEYSEAGKDHVANDWTNGCVALSNAEIEELWRAVPDGTPVQIKP